MEAEELLREIVKYVDSEEFQCRSAAEKEHIVTHAIPLAVSAFIGLTFLEAAQKGMELGKLDKELGIARLEKIWSTK